eukprot:6219225-Prymnesium_polylepis.1
MVFRRASRRRRACQPTARRPAAAAAEARVPCFGGAHGRPLSEYVSAHNASNHTQQPRRRNLLDESRRRLLHIRSQAGPTDEHEDVPRVAIRGRAQGVARCHRHARPRVGLDPTG